MKILHVITCIDDAGGAEKLMEDLLPGLKKEGCDVSCLVFYGFDSKNRRTLEASGVKIYELSRNNHYYSPIKILKLIPYVRQFDIVHTHNTPAVIFTAIANLMGKAKLVMTVHNTDGKLRHIWGLKMFDKWIHSRYHAIICCSEAAEKNLRPYIPNHPNIRYVSNGVKLSKFVQAEPSVDGIMSNHDTKKIVMVAWFRKQKNHQVLIDALRYLPSEFEVFFVGNGETKDECIKKSEELGLNSRIHFLGMRSDVPNILKASDYIVLSSHYEGLSLSSIEGMAVGKPFIASDVNGLHEIVGGAGVLFPDGNAKALANSILELDHNPVLYQETAKKCYERAMLYDISSMVKGYKEVYDKLYLKK